MPRLDAHHHIVRRALEKEGWTITHDPLMIKYKGLHVMIDLGAEQRLVIDAQRIAIEIKVFGQGSKMDAFEKAIGQYSLYRDLLKWKKSDRELYLAVALSVHEKFFQKPAVQEYIADHGIHLLVFDHEREEVVEWIRQES